MALVGRTRQVQGHRRPHPPYIYEAETWVRSSLPGNLETGEYRMKRGVGLNLIMISNLFPVPLMMSHLLFCCVGVVNTLWHPWFIFLFFLLTNFYSKCRMLFSDLWKSKMMKQPVATQQHVVCGCCSLHAVDTTEVWSHFINLSPRAQ